jgi:hypothetical protein
MTVELLAACCEGAEKADLERLEQACFALRETARWDEEGRGWARQEFALLRLAAQVADRPGHLLLIHSLERTFWSMASWVQPLLDSEAVDEWALCAMYALGEKDAQGLRRELPPLLKRCEARLLGSREPDGQDADTPEAPSSTPEERPPLQLCEAQLLGSREPAGQDADSREAPSTKPEELSPLLQACEARLFGSSEPDGQAADTREVPSTTPFEPHEGGEPAPEAAREEPPGAAVPNLSGCRTGSSHAPPTEEPQPDSSAPGTGHGPEHALLGAGRPPVCEENGAYMPPPPCLALDYAPLAGTLLAAGGCSLWQQSLLHSFKALGWNPVMMGWASQSTASWPPTGSYQWVQSLLHGVVAHWPSGEDFNSAGRGTGSS